MGNQGNYNLHKDFFPSRTTKVLIFPLQMLHKILITKRLNNLILPSIQLHVPFQQGQSQWWSPSVHQSLHITQVHRLVNFCDSFFAWRRPQTGSVKPGSGAPSPPVSGQDHLLHHGVWEAKAQSTAASLGLWRLSPEFEALPATWRVGVSGWNSST